MATVADARAIGGPTLTVKAYAKHRGVTKEAVEAAISTGRIKLLPDGRIDPVLADEQWAENTRLPSGRRIGPPPPGTMAHEGARLAGARADIAMLEFKRKNGELVSRTDVRIEAFTCGRLVKEKLMVIGVRIGPVLAGTTDAGECVKIVTGEIRKALEDLTTEE